MTALAPIVTLDDLPEDTGRVMRSNRKLKPEDTPEADHIDGLDEWIVYGNDEPIYVWASDEWHAKQVAAAKQRGFRAGHARRVPPSITDLKEIEKPLSPSTKGSQCKYFGSCGNTLPPSNTSGLCKPHATRKTHGCTEEAMWRRII